MAYEHLPNGGGKLRSHQRLCFLEKEIDQLHQDNNHALCKILILVQMQAASTTVTGMASSPDQFTCVCENSCPSYEEQVCASNGRTFKQLVLAKARNL
ncbi:hypothetical protein OS493_040064 [Desmophyllum pertusum]|uniref:Uncharacterized protein n=1 Tax=Desmophyllum pertusum TaxID=174260 RepID=A0A9X0CN70_9CNID|nr:hypothetical protein OS493_040064 [Desmophyllum pertusum]